MTYDLSEFLAKPGLAGWGGGLMDEYARAAVDFCNVVEALAPAKFTDDVKPDSDPDCVSIRKLCVHVLSSAHGYGSHLLRAMGVEVPPPPSIDENSIKLPAAVRPLLAQHIRRTEGIVADIVKLPEKQQEALVVRPRWALPMQVDLLLEHAIVHLLRHRRQIERW
jgi:hypothetical protein